MESKLKHLVVAALVLSVAEVALPCSGGWTDSFHLTLRPDAPIERYVEGDLGIVLPTFAHSYLVVAYRYLSGHPLTAAEDRAASSLIGRRLRHESNDGSPAVVKWIQARSRVPGAPSLGSHLEVESERGFASYINCPADAFYTAIRTLNERIDKFGASDPAVLDWVNAQDAVFGNCSSTASVPPAAANLPAVFRADRDYQLAAAAFYSEQFDDAHARFTAIAADPSSPWRETAAYVAVRALIRKATLSAGSDGEPFHRASLEAAEKEVDALLADPARRDIHNRAAQLRGFIEFRLHPEQRTGELARNLSVALTAQDLSDYTDLLAGQTPHDDMTDWIQTFHDDQTREHDHDRLPKPHAIARWRETHSLPWLIAAIASAQPNDADAHDLVAAAREVSPDSPGHLTLAYHSARLLIGFGEVSAARSLLDGALALPQLPTSSRNLLHDLRLPLAQTISDFSADAVQQLAGDEYDYERGYPWAPGSGFSEDAARIINTRMPLSFLIDLADHTPNDQSLRYVTWTRAVLLGKHDIAAARAPSVEWSDPGLRNALVRYARTKPSDQPREAYWVILNFPLLQPYAESGTAYRSRDVRSSSPEEVDHVLRNWWCIDGRELFDQGDQSDVETPLFLRASSADAEAERAKLHEAGSGSTYILSSALAWARAEPTNSRVPEALGRAILGIGGRVATPDRALSQKPRGRSCIRNTPTASGRQKRSTGTTQACGESACQAPCSPSTKTGEFC